MKPLTQDDRGTDVYPIVPPQTHVMPKVNGNPKPVRAGRVMPDDEGFAYPEPDEQELLSAVRSDHPIIGLVIVLMLCITAIIIAYWATH